MTRRATLFLALAMVLAVFACAPKPEQAILGKWIDPEGNTWEFFKDGTGTLTPKDSPWGGSFKFSFPEKDRLRIEGVAGNFVVKVSIGRDEMSWWLPSEPNEEPGKLRRAKD
jgi:hypothetical protein